MGKFKILMYDCNISVLLDKKIDFEVKSHFDKCGCSKYYHIFAFFFQENVYNLFEFARNYLSSVNCFCMGVERNDFYKHCMRLECTLNGFIKKVCLDSENVPGEFNLEEIDEYLIKRLKANLMFFYLKEFNSIVMSLDSPSWFDFFVGKETMQIYIKKMELGIFDVEFIFCCPCFVQNVEVFSGRKNVLSGDLIEHIRLQNREKSYVIEIRTLSLL